MKPVLTVATLLNILNMAQIMSKNELNFKDNYELLKKNTSLLESQEEFDIDQPDEVY